jgi:hypothetical protein
MWLVLVIAALVAFPMSVGVAALRAQLSADRSQEPYMGL